MNSSQLVSYDMFKSALVGWGMSDGLPVHFVASALAGTVATTICSPADVVKSRVMHSSELGPLTVIRTSLKNEGPGFLFKGWLPSWSESTCKPLLTRSPPHAKHYLHVRLLGTVEACRRSRSC